MFQGRWSKMLRRTSPISLSVPTASTIEVFSTVSGGSREGLVLAVSSLTPTSHSTRDLPS